MTDEKICPIMSRPMEVLEDCEEEDCHFIGGIFKGNYAPLVPCLKEKCMAWVPECPRLNAQDRECETEDCIAMDRDFSECKGGCRLI